LLTRARARRAVGEVPQAIHDASRSVEVARALGDPAVLLKALNVLIDVDGSDVLSSEAHQCRERMLSQLDDARLRDRVVAANSQSG